MGGGEDGKHLEREDDEAPPSPKLRTGSAQGEREGGQARTPPLPGPAGGEKKRLRERHDGPSTGSGQGPLKQSRLRPRHDGFSPPKQKKFLKALAKTGCVADACRTVRISTTTAYRTRDKLPAFERQWKAAQDKAGSHIAVLAWERGVIGIEEPVWYYGKQVGTRVKRSDSIFRMLLQGSNREKYGRIGAVARQGNGPNGWRGGKRPRVATDAEVHDALLKALKAFGVTVEAEEAAERASRSDAGEGEGSAP